MEVPQEILSRYLERRCQELKHCLEYLEAGDYQKLEKTGHKLKGNGETFGFSDLSKIGSQLELAAQKSDPEQSLQALQAFSAWMKSHRN